MARSEPAEKLPPARVGAFTYSFATAEFHWSAEVAAMHGYPPQPMTVDADFVLAHKHSDDRERVAELYQEVLDTRASLSSRHRIVDRAGVTHRVVVISKSLTDDNGDPIGLDGFYVDLSAVLEQQAEQAFEQAVDAAVEAAMDRAMDTAVAEFTVHRSVIEQAKGMVMMAYNIPADRAFDILRWRSQQTNTKLRTLCELIVKRTADELTLSDDNRASFDQILLAAPGPEAYEG